MAERICRMRYRVINLTDGRVWDCRTAREVCRIVWANPPIRCYAIFKNGCRWRHALTTASVLELDLRIWKPKPSQKERI